MRSDGFNSTVRVSKVGGDNWNWLLCSYYPSADIQHISTLYLNAIFLLNGENNLWGYLHEKMYD
ncbi:hypothetical protein A2533_02485 [Candidatus Falkowbacteria bacterium RIFOXYD2_FULL_35_9]|uniref:Uncharacterized protein n=1 Tax=Candidatus Falkowbacteria bacterium RIFOXYC2_FULL_36_12 TaxID=1798002 RepID=A0A1F5T447_9BACT|nr:MAG: hypothetical protein A2300_02045 [Candidatus Falkowbacteria bacterium RIFOXYB2_FULL_35_7]OGF33486.1 MAG: hypothetical protein A2478_02225 [Candidatus Falkowbacteria bacterium RIFOXYC2_FULL_36_12]OGF46844.1 MAG: hypothetical protein A2533_02485 [Candidatus Falkowbacteria bacterium RIFOXYD2_FULL_35_9]